MWSIKIQLYSGENFIQIAVPDICLQNLESNSNKLILPISSEDNFFVNITFILFFKNVHTYTM